LEKLGYHLRKPDNKTRRENPLLTRPEKGSEGVRVRQDLPGVGLEIIRQPGAPFRRDGPLPVPVLLQGEPGDSDRLPDLPQRKPRRVEAMLTDWRGTLDRVAERAGWKRGEIRSKMFRHSYCSARLQTLDGGAPVSPFTVSRELGHGSQKMVEEVYSHLGTMRHRTEVVEYKVEQHWERLKDRLAVLTPQL
jgi:integrase